MMKPLPSTQNPIERKSRIYLAVITASIAMQPAVLLATQAELLQPPITSSPSSHTTLMSFIAITILILQALLILGLQRSRINNKRAKKVLRESQKELELRIHERTESLHKSNRLLIDEVTRHESTEYQLRDTKNYLQSMINSMPSNIIGVTEKGYITHWNAAAENTFAIFSEDAINQQVSELLPNMPLGSDSIAQAIDSGEAQAITHSDLNANNERRYFEITIYPLISLQKPGAVIRIDEVTRRVNMENAMIQSEKIYSLGEVVAGIAHEINNPLSVILQNVQNIIRRTNKSFPQNQLIANEIGVNLEQLENYWKKREIDQFLEAIRDAGERSTTIVTTMLEFSRSNLQPKTLTDMNSLIKQAVKINENIYNVQKNNETPEVKMDLDETIPLVRCSSAELQQVLLNLLRNATQAINSSNIAIIKPYIHLKTYTRENQLIVEVTDNGPGMTDSVKNHLFEPFFSTKSAGSGTGLGLSISYFIITERHQGSIEVKSTIGKGSTFLIKLPL